jgi:hypothetical protein
MAAYGVPAVDREWIVGEDSVRDAIFGRGAGVQGCFCYGGLQEERVSG